ncbi:MAG: hypothetical protein IPL71_08645 [Anaerolineales bacterium]|uniref:hypothetical protein n=1 Tax=Candidatus Villigracilis proximus TaxID=3140683 RepID=UPI0031358691|nr:hypothetical protein [Anaerolineales bacterium]
MSASLGLYRLQQVDRQIDRARSQLDTIRQTLENDVELGKHSNAWKPPKPNITAPARN